VTVTKLLAVLPLEQTVPCIPFPSYFPLLSGRTFHRAVVPQNAASAYVRGCDRVDKELFVSLHSGKGSTAINNACFNWKLQMEISVSTGMFFLV